MAVEMVEACDVMLARLEDETLQNIALLKLQGHTNDEISDQLNCATRTVERKLNRIREIWSSYDEQT